MSQNTSNTDFTESELERRIITHIQKFLMEMGKGYAFVARQQHILMYDEMKRNEGDNPTLGIVLCSDTDEDIAKYSVLHGHEQLFASKYKTCLPSEQQLREEIEMQKRFYYLQKKEEAEADGDI